MRPSQRNAISFVLIALLLWGAFSLGLDRGERRANSLDLINAVENKDLYKPEAVDFSAFWKAWNIINEKYVPASSTDAQVSNEEKMFGAIQGLVSSLGDPHTVFFPPVENEIFQSDVRGNFEGVGMEVGMRDGVLTVISPLKDTPAYRAGVETGDKIIRIDDKITTNLTTDEAISLIRGKKGTTVTISVIRNGSSEPIVIPIVRDTINIPTIRTEQMSNGIFLIELYNFSANSPNLFRSALREFVSSGKHKLLLDLRGNPGGYLEASIDMASWFLPPGKVIVREDFGGNKDEHLYRSKGYDIFNNNLDLVILIDGGSASASEILAGALREHGVATLVGDRTFGKGSVQELVDVTSNTSIKVTIARWLTPNGVSISDGGLEPDVLVKVTREDIEAGRDTQIEKAIEILLSQ